MDGALQEEAIMSETREGSESEGGREPRDAEHSGRGLRAEAGLLRMKSICCRRKGALNNHSSGTVCVRVNV